MGNPAFYMSIGTPNRRVTRRGFTLIELLAATTLLAMFMLTAASVTASLGRTRHAMRRDALQAPYLQHPLQTLRRDLTNARSYKLNGQTLTLLGYGLLHAQNLNPLHLPAEVTYTLRSDGQTSWLLRTQRSADPLGTAHRLTQPLIGGLSGIAFHFAPLPVPTTETPIEQETPEITETTTGSETTEFSSNQSGDDPSFSEGLSQPIEHDTPIDPLLTRRGFRRIPTHVRLTLRYDDPDLPNETHSLYPRRR